MKTKREFNSLKYPPKARSRREAAENTCHIILTNRLFATIDGIDNRPHIRAGIYSIPSVISIPGIVEGPAKPKEYYLYKQKYQQLGIWEKEEANVKKRFKGTFIDYNDKRMTEVVKGYIAQAIFFFMCGEPFCENRNCRLYNAHWQADLINAQVKKGTFCKKHKFPLT